MECWLYDDNELHGRRRRRWRKGVLSPRPPFQFGLAQYNISSPSFDFLTDSVNYTIFHQPQPIHNLNIDHFVVDRSSQPLMLSILAHSPPMSCIKAGRFPTTRPIHTSSLLPGHFQVAFQRYGGGENPDDLYTGYTDCNK